MLKIFQKKPGRPISIDKKSITKKCLDFYWSNGIDNNSFNQVIKHAGVSKGSIYRLYGCEDALQKNVLMEYFNIFIKDWLELITKTSIKEYVMNITSSLITNKSRPCLFHRSKAEKYKLGPQTKNYVGQIESKIKKGYQRLIKEDFKKNKKMVKKQEVIDLADFLINCMTTLTLIKLNSNSHKSLVNFSKYIIRQFK